MNWGVAERELQCRSVKQVVHPLSRLNSGTDARYTRDIPFIIFVIVYLLEGHFEGIFLDTVSNLQNDTPEAVIIVLGDFNQEQFKIHGFTQYVNCNIWQNRKIDLYFCNLK